MSFSRKSRTPDQIDAIRDEMLSTVEIAIREGDDEARKHLMEKANPVGKGKCHCRWRSPN
ncbi:hypothetical protein CRE_20942 [Caenorhabditis remanei]|uniref:Uncharacterized protein n=1 Tax=Caenorhabditis remanei TaxID=31234 RepID=E3N931_CAERE|nr:hypothetical protein CRE_20942 [Caenorhabditis remanei]